MHGSHRSIVIALIGLSLFLAFLLGIYVRSLSEPEQQRYQSYQTAKKSDAGTTPVVDMAEAPKNRTPCIDPKSETEADLCAQWRSALATEESAEWTKWGVIASFIGITFLAWQIALTRQAVQDTGEATEAMREANDTARTTASAQLRPYVHVNDINWQAVGGGGEQYIEFKVRFINSGQTPAKEMQMAVHGYFLERDDGPVDINIVLDPASQNHPLGPGNEIMTPSFTVGEADLTAVWRGDKQLFIASIARYRDNFSSEVRVTRCHYKITVSRHEGEFNWVWWNVIGPYNDAT
jgi:hypothetical protein